MADIPLGIEPGTWWRHHNGAMYCVLLHTNLYDYGNAPGGNDRYPVTVVYRGENDRVWSRRADDWHRSMTLVPGYSPRNSLLRQLMLEDLIVQFKAVEKSVRKGWFHTARAELNGAQALLREMQLRFDPQN